MKIGTAMLTCTHTLRVTPTESDELTNHAQSACISVSELLRRRALGIRLPPVAPPRLNIQIYGELAQLSADLQKALRFANEAEIQARSPFVNIVSSCLEQVNAFRLELIGVQK